MEVASTSTSVPLASHRAPEERFAATSRAVSFANAPTATKASHSERDASRKPLLPPDAAPKTHAQLVKFASRPTRLRRPAAAFASVPEAGSATRRPVYVVTSTNAWNRRPINQPAATRLSVKIYRDPMTALVRMAMKAIRSRAVRFATRSNADANHRTRSSEELVCWPTALVVNRLVRLVPNASP